MDDRCAAVHRNKINWNGLSLHEPAMLDAIEICAIITLRFLCFVIDLQFLGDFIFCAKRSVPLLPGNDSYDLRGAQTATDSQLSYSV